MDESKTLGGDQDLRTSTLVRHRPIQGESNIDFLGETEGSLPQLQDSFPDAGEAINDFWSMSGNFIYRHHVEPRVKLYSPREESFPIPLKYIDVSRTTHTNLMLSRRNVSMIIGISMGEETCQILGQVSLNLLHWKKNLYVVREEINKKTADIQARSFMARTLEVNGTARQAGEEAKVVE